MGKRIAIMGGSFNPIHVGHSIIAGSIIERHDIDQLWLMVSPQNPLKQDKSLAADYHRLRMTQMVAERIEGVITSAFEFTLPKPSYTIDTLNALREKFPDDEFSLVIGADNWRDWDKWKAHDEILRRHRLLIYPRLGCDINIPPTLAQRVTVIDAPIIEISSTEIRNRLHDKKSISFMVPHDVETYIKEHKLFTK